MDICDAMTCGVHGNSETNFKTLVGVHVETEVVARYAGKTKGAHPHVR